MKHSIQRFNVRAYGLLVQQNNVLISHEQYKGKQLLKFPGGGVEFGEGIIDCLQREFKEELGVQIQLQQVFYATEHFIQSAFNPEEQLISIYYLVTTQQPIQQTEHEIEWVNLSTNQPSMQQPAFTFPQDAKVFKLLQAAYI